MMGERQMAQDALFYEFSLERHVPADHWVRGIDRSIDLSDIRAAASLLQKVEMLFAHLKRILRLGRLRLRGPNEARDEFRLAAAAQNLRKLAKLLPNGPQVRPA